MNPILVGVDGSPASVAALRWALAEAALRSARVHAVTVWSQPVVASPFGAIAPSLGADGLGALVEAAQRRLDQAIAEASGGSVTAPIDGSVVEGGAAAALIAAAADADLLVVGSRGLGGFGGLLLGSVSHQCAQHAPCPVVIVRDPDTHHQS